MTLEINGLLEQMQTKRSGNPRLTRRVFTFKARLELSDSELEVISCGGQLRYLKKQLGKE
ncbi:MAG: hypothetical protein ACLUD2_06030 [Clostridium sp.]